MRSTPFVNPLETIRMPTPFSSLRRRILHGSGAAALAACALAFHAPQASAQAYPDKPVKG